MKRFGSRSGLLSVLVGPIYFKRLSADDKGFFNVLDALSRLILFCENTAKALTNMYRYVGSPKRSLLMNVSCSIIQVPVVRVPIRHVKQTDFGQFALD